MRKTGFTFGKQTTYYEYTKERADVVEMRENYLLWVDKYRKEGREINFQDETWANENMGSNFVCQYTEANDTCYKVASRKGSRCIISHLGSREDGLLDGSLLIFRGEKSNSTADYHTEMDTEVFFHGCKLQCFRSSEQ